MFVRWFVHHTITKKPWGTLGAQASHVGTTKRRDNFWEPGYDRNPWVWSGRGLWSRCCFSSCFRVGVFPWCFLNLAFLVLEAAGMGKALKGVLSIWFYLVELLMAIFYFSHLSTWYSPPWHTPKIIPTLPTTLRSQRCTRRNLKGSHPLFWNLHCASQFSHPSWVGATELVSMSAHLLSLTHYHSLIISNHYSSLLTTPHH